MSGLPKGMIRRDVLERNAKRHAALVFRKLWPQELRERWPEWTRHAIDHAEALAAEAYAAGFEAAMSEIYGILNGTDGEAK